MRDNRARPIHFREAVELKPGDAKARVNLGELLASRGLVAEALEQYETALELAIARRDNATANFARGPDRIGSLGQ